MMNTGNAEIIEDVFRSFTSVMAKTIVVMAQMSLVAQLENQLSKNARIDASFILNPVETL